MKLGRLLIAAVVLAALSGAVWWSNKKEAEKAAKPPADTSPKILSLNDGDIKGLEIKKRTGEDTVLKKDDSGKWSITAPKPLPADQSATGNVASSLSNVSADRVIDDNATDIAGYGLQPAVVEVIATMKDGKTKTLLIGDMNPSGTAVYAKVADDPRLFTMSSSNKSSFDKESKDLRDKRLLTFDQDKASRVELTAKKETIEFGRINQNEWQILKPKPLRADGWTVEELVRKVKEAQMDLSVSDEDAKKAVATFASAAPVATVKVTDPSGIQTLEVRKSKDDYYAKSSAVEGVNKVTKDLGTALDKSLDDFRNKKLFDFGFSDPTRVEFKDGARDAVYEKVGDKWMSGGKAMDAASVQALIDKLRDLSTTKFVEGAFGTPQVEITVASQEGKRNEKIQIAPEASGKFVAKREGEPTLYELEASTVGELRGASADVKAEAKPDSKATDKKK